MRDSMKVIEEKYGIQITKPWNSEMYDHNDMVATLMKSELRIAINKANDNDEVNTLNELITICGGIRMSTDCYTQGEIWEECLKELETVQNYWLNQEYPYAVSKGWVSEIGVEFVGY